MKKIIKLIATFFPILAIFCLIIAPIFLVAELFNFIGDNLYGVKHSNKSTLALNEKLDDFYYNEKYNFDYKNIIHCVGSKKYYKKLNVCMELIKNKKYDHKSETSLSSLFLTNDIKEYIGEIPRHYFTDILIPAKYECNNFSSNLANVNANGNCKLVSSEKLIYPFSNPSTEGILKNYGYNVQDNVFVLNDFQVYIGHLKSFGKGTFEVVTKTELIQKIDDDLKVIYQGNFDPLIEPGKEILPGENIALNNGNYFKMYVKYKELSINPAIFILSERSSLKLNKFFGNKNVPLKEATENLHLLKELKYNQPFSKIIITQLAKVPGYYDNSRSHGAIDIIAAKDLGLGANPYLKSFVNGKVVENGYNAASGYFITVEDDKTKIRVNYSHLLLKSYYEVGSNVTTEDILGFMGNSGFSTGTHLHMQISIPQNDGSYGWVDFIDLLNNYEILGSSYQKEN